MISCFDATAIASFVENKSKRTTARSQRYKKDTKIIFIHSFLVITSDISDGQFNIELFTSMFIDLSKIDVQNPNIL